MWRWISRSRRICSSISTYHASSSNGRTQAQSPSSRSRRAGCWSDRDRQQPVGDSGRHEPRQADAIADAELQRALEDPDPLRAIAGLVARWSAAFVLDPDGVTRTRALGSERMARRLRDALPGGRTPLRAAVWEFLRPMLSPRLAELHRDAFVIDDGPQTTVNLAAHRGESSLAELDLGARDVDAA
jgi:hypothetical protein